MTDHKLLSRLLASLDPAASDLRMISRNGRLLLGLPRNAEAARRALRLYQPQRRMARMMVAGIHGLNLLGLHSCVLPKLQISPCETTLLNPPIFGIEHGTCGVLLGSTEHRVRRAIASYRNAGVWEVAKVSFGDAGAQVLEQEALVLKKLQSVAAGAPQILGLHRGHGVTAMRMPYLTGVPIPRGESTEVLSLLKQWISEQTPQPIHRFSEWPVIKSALSKLEHGAAVLDQLSKERLRPVICHGDFARWNLLRQKSGQLVALDWEWGHDDGMPGIDLVHYFLQDARLVERLSPPEAIRKTANLLHTPSCREYLDKTAWSTTPILPVIACLAWKQGAGHQDNSHMLDAATATFRAM